MGSGILILRAIQKYGKCHFKKDILFDFNTFEEMNAKEAEIVTSLNTGAKVEIIEKQDEWYKVKYQNYEGYMFAEYIKLDE